MASKEYEQHKQDQVRALTPPFMAGARRAMEKTAAIQAAAKKK